MASYDIKSSVNQEKQQKINRSYILNLIYKEKLCSRAQLAEMSGLKRATITNIVNEFIECGLVIEDGLLDGAKGRRSIGIRINGESYGTLGVKLNRDGYSVCLMGLSGKMFETWNFPILSADSPEEILKDMKEQLLGIIQKKRRCQILAVGLTVPGPYKQKGDQIVFVTHLYGWEGIPILQQLQAEIPVPVFVENDANAGAFAQQWYTVTEEKEENLIYIVAGQGVGCGIIADGQLLRGERGIAGELGHVSINFQGPRCQCGNRGCIENYCSVISLLEKAKEILPGIQTLEQFGEVLRNGDEKAVQLYKETVNYLAFGIVSMINQLNPRTIIIGDQLVDLDAKLFLETVQGTIEDLIGIGAYEKVIIKANTIPYNPTLVGAGIIAAKKIFEDPNEFLK